jgi:ABC-type sulfate transport system permease component
VEQAKAFVDYALSLGVATLWLSVIVLIPLAALDGRPARAFWDAVSGRQAMR